MARDPYKPLDRRQRLAAVILLSAVDLPQPLPDVAVMWMAAAKNLPGVKVDELTMGEGRRAGLELARALIDEMLKEITT
jgi:hypothetical protein